MALTLLPSSDLSIVVVTYRQDLPDFQRLCQSLKKWARRFPVYVVVNDDIKFYHELQSQIPAHYTTLHWSMIASTWNGTLDWFSQQYFKIMISRVVDSAWYAILDSDNYLMRELRAHKVLRYGRAYCAWDRCPVTNPVWDPYYQDRLRRAFRYLGVSENYPQHMGNSTPFMIHTQSMRCLSEIVQPDWMDGGAGSTYEFFLYCAYIIKTGQARQLYHRSCSPLTDVVFNAGWEKLRSRYQPWLTS